MANRISTFSDGSIKISNNLYRVLHGTERPDIGWLGPNYGSFDIVPACPDPVMQKGSPIKISNAVWDKIVSMNPASGGFTQQQKTNWLLSSETDPDMFMQYKDGQYSIPSPGVSGGAILNILGFEGQMARVQAWNVFGDIPESFPEHLVFTWYGITLGGVLYIPRGGVKTPVMFNRNFFYVPAKWIAKL